MIRVVFICLLISIGRSQDCSFKEAELLELQKIFLETSDLTKIQDNRDTVICIGTPKAGTSTLVNYLIGNKLRAVRSSQISRLTIELADKTTTGPAIQAWRPQKPRITSIKIPSRWNSNLISNVAIWDLSGFNGYRGPAQDISNAICLYQLLKNVNGVKLILVIHFYDIANDNIKPFLKLLKNLEKIMGNSFKYNFPSITIIVSKAFYEEDGNVVNNEYISKKLDKLVLKVNIPDLSDTCRDFILYITNNNNRIGFFRQPITVGDITYSDIADNIIQAIEDSTFIRKESVKDLQPSISQLSTTCLHLTRWKLLSSPKFHELHEFVINLLNTKIEKINNIKLTSPDSELNDIKSDLVRIRTLLNKFDAENLNAHEGIELLKSIDPTVENKIQNDALIKDMNLIAFVETLLQTGVNNELHQIVRFIISNLLAKTENVITVVESKAGLKRNPQ